MTEWVEAWCRERMVWPEHGLILPTVERYRAALIDLVIEATRRARAGETSWINSELRAELERMTLVAEELRRRWHDAEERAASIVIVNDGARRGAVA